MSYTIPFRKTEMFHSIFFISFFCLMIGVGSTPLFAQYKTGTEQEMSEIGTVAVSYYKTISNDKVPAPEGTAVSSTRTFNGQNGSDSYGTSVSSAGDVNGDGYSDVIVGATGYSGNTGRSYIYFCGPGMDNTADVTLTGEAANDNFGRSVSTAGDVNGDGYADVIIGTYVSQGRAYIHYGGISMDTIPDVILDGEAVNNYFGASVATAGDVNGDGYADVIVGAYGYSSFTGRAYIYYGGSSMNNLADVTMNGEASGNGFGLIVSLAGDVNGDGFSDVIVDAWAYSTSTGRAYIYYGASAMDNIADVTLTGEGVNNQFGRPVSTAGDVNGDGYDDVIAGAASYASSTGRVYIFYGGTNMNNVADVIMNGEGTNNRFGWSVSKAGDVNGDGYGDVIVGAYGYSSNTGRTYFYYGGASMNISPDIVTTGETAGDNFGSSVASAGDVNGDGYSDVIIGATGYASFKGRAYLYQYSLTGAANVDEKFKGEATNNYYGNSVSSAGDVNGDGYADVIVCAYGYSSNTGRAYIYFGGTAMDTTADVTLNGEAGNNYFGYSVSGAGDVNGDGYADVIVGAFGYSTSTGRAYIYYGGTSMNNTADVTMTGEATNSSFGWTVSTAGDVNGDGYGDVIVGAHTYSSYTGRAYIFYGGSAMNNTADVTMSGTAVNYSFGYSVSSAGDVNGDSYGDVIVGEYGYSTQTGRAHIFFGGSSMNNGVDITFVGEGTSNNFGYSVSTAGDVNGDGYSDVIVGAYGYSSGTGRAYIYYGGFVMDIAADVTLSGEGIVNYFGASVSAAGDVNRDGYADVIVGAYQYASYTGRAYVYFGGAAMNNSADISMTGETTSSYFGNSVASAGDVNGDGYPDLIVGAIAMSSYAGCAYVYRSWAPPAAPRIAFVKDVPFDQGGKVEVKWIRSQYDAKGINGITSYSIERSGPAGVSGFFWEKITNIEPQNNPQYSYTAVTPNDSMVGNSGAFFFRVTAKTSEPNQYWRSNIMSGYSKDNIPPVATAGGMLMVLGNGYVSLSWHPNTSDADAGGYNVYRSTTAGFTPDQGNLLAATRDTVFTDTTTTAGQQYYYRIKTSDIHGNESASSSQLAADVPLSVNVLSLTVMVTRFSAQLNWKTATETNNHGFDIERRVIGYPEQVSPDVIGSNAPKDSWVKTGFVEGGGTSNSERTYSYTENIVTAGKYEYRLKQISNDGVFRYSPTVEVTVGSAPLKFELAQNYPNPFNPTTNIEFTVPVTGQATLKVFNAIGQEVATLFDGIAEARKYNQVKFDAVNFASGIFFAKLSFSGISQTRKLVLMK